MNRRTFVRAAAALSAVAATSRVAGLVAPAHAQQKEFAPRPGTWRTFEITTRVEILEPAGVNRAWLPIPSVKSEYQKPLGDQWTGSAKVMKVVSDGTYGANMLYAEFAPGETAPVVELTSRFQTQDRAVDWSKKIAADEDPAGPQDLDEVDRAHADGRDRPRDGARGYPGQDDRPREGPRGL